MKENRSQIVLTSLSNFKCFRLEFVGNILIFQLFLVSLNAQTKEIERKNSDNQKAQSAISEITVQPQEIDDPLVNPFCGWGIWLGPRYFDGRVFSNEYNTTGFGDDAELFSWAVVDWMWSDLEPEEGKFQWAKLDSILDFWKARNKQFLIRLWVTDDPGWNGAQGSTACPDWIWKAGVKYHEYKGEDSSLKREPDYIDPSYEKIYIPLLRKFLTAFASRYQRSESHMMMSQVMGYGQWGEWHTMWSHYQWPDKDIKHKVLSGIIRQYMDIFNSTRLAISYCFDSDNDQVNSLNDFTYRQATDLAIANDFCLTRHGFIDGLWKWDTKVMETHWKHCPLLAEGDWSYTDVKNHGTHGTFDQNLDIMLEWHSDFCHFYTDAEGYKRMMREDRPALERGLKAGGIGYRYVLKSASWDKELIAGRMLVFRQLWVNRNAGWCMMQFPLKIYLTDKEGNEKFSVVDNAFDISKLYMGDCYSKSTMVSVSDKVIPGEYDLRIALVDYEGKPALKLAIDGTDRQGRYKLGIIKILAKK
jgi:hypothetical protein